MNRRRRIDRKPAGIGLRCVGFQRSLGDIMNRVPHVTEPASERGNRS